MLLKKARVQSAKRYDKTKQHQAVKTNFKKKIQSEMAQRYYKNL